MERSLVVDSLIVCQLFVVVFIALHDWIPLGKLNNVKAAKAADPTWKLLVVTVSSTLPFAIGLIGSVCYAATNFPNWLMWWLWISYGLGVYGFLRAWWIPYLLVKDATRSTRYQARFAGTHAFLPKRNGIRPDTLHVTLHVVILIIIALLCVLSLSKFSGPNVLLRGSSLPQTLSLS
jgi:hypothetical protein